MPAETHAETRIIHRKVTPEKMEERRRVTTVRQLEVLIEFLEGNRDLALGRVRSKEARAVAARLWRECADTLNSLGPARTGKEWAKVWNDHKCRVRAKLVAINASQQATGGGLNNAPVLSPLEEKVANIIGRNVGPLPNVRQDHFAGSPSVPSGNDAVEDVVAEEVGEVMPEDVVTEEVGEVMPAVINEHQNSPPVIINVPYEEHISYPSPTPSVSGQAPSPQARSESRSVRVRRVRERRRAERVARQPTAPTTAQAQAPQTTSSRNALEESRAIVLKIEEMRAQAALNFSASFRMIAESIDRMSRQYCSSGNPTEHQS